MISPYPKADMLFIALCFLAGSVFAMAGIKDSFGVGPTVPHWLLGACGALVTSGMCALYARQIKS